jgi:hypothetical protein
MPIRKLFCFEIENGKRFRFKIGSPSKMFENFKISA